MLTLEHIAAGRSLNIEYPMPDETINGPGYSIQISSSDDAGIVEVSIDRGPWRPCRRACGYWWYDWSDFRPGPHSVSARGLSRDGSPLNSMTRRFAAALQRPRHRR